MSARTSKRSLVALLTAGALVFPVFPTAAVADRGVSRANSGPPNDGVHLHRDGTKAVPFEAYPNGTELRRDGSKAVPFVADLEPDVAASAGDGFHWGDAAVGAGAAIALASLGGASLALRGRRAPDRASVRQPKATAT